MADQEYFELTDTAQAPVRAHKTGDKALVINGTNIALVEQDSVQAQIEQRLDAMSAAIQGRLTFATLAELQAAGAPPNGQSAEVLLDSDNNGIYLYDAGAWAKSDFGSGNVPALVEAIAAVKSDLTTSLATLSALGYDLTDADTIVPFILGQNHRLVLGFDRAGNLQNQRLDAIDDSIVDVAEDVATMLSGITEMKFFDPQNATKYPIVLDGHKNVILGYNTETAELEGLWPKFFSRGRSRLMLARADITHILTYGQSLSVGALSQPAFSGATAYENLMFNGGTAEARDAEDMVSFVPLSCVGNEVPVIAMCETVTGSLVNRGFLASDYVLFANAPGQGAQPIEALEKGTIYYDRLIAQFRQAKKLANAEGKTYAVAAMAWIQGESNGTTSEDFYFEHLNQLLTDISNDVCVITGQSIAPQFIGYQNYHEKVMLACQRVADERDDYRMGYPLYHLAHTPDTIHLTGESSAILGAALGYLIAHIAEFGEEPPVTRIIRATVRGAVLTLDYDCLGDITIDDTLSGAAVKDHGYQFLDSSGLLTPTDITVSGRQVIVTLPKSPTGALKIRYALDYQSTIAPHNTGGSIVATESISYLTTTVRFPAIAQAITATKVF